MPNIYQLIRACGSARGLFLRCGEGANRQSTTGATERTGCARTQSNIPTLLSFCHLSASFWLLGGRNPANLIVGACLQRGVDLR